MENLCSREAYHCDRVERAEKYLTRESRRHPSTEGAQKKWGGLTWPGKIRGTFPEVVTSELDLKEWEGEERMVEKRKSLKCVTKSVCQKKEE